MTPTDALTAALSDDLLVNALIAAQPEGKPLGHSGGLAAMRAVLVPALLRAAEAKLAVALTEDDRAALIGAAALCESESQRYSRTVPTTASHWEFIAVRLRALSLFPSVEAGTTDQTQLCGCGHVLGAHATGGCAHSLPSKVDESTGRFLTQMCPCKGFEAEADKGEKTDRWAVENCHTLAHRELRRMASARRHGDETTPVGPVETSWQHIIRMCERTGYIPVSSPLRLRQQDSDEQAAEAGTRQDDLRELLRDELDRPIWQHVEESAPALRRSVLRIIDSTLAQENCQSGNFYVPSAPPSPLRPLRAEKEAGTTPCEWMRHEFDGPCSRIVSYKSGCQPDRFGLTPHDAKAFKFCPYCGHPLMLKETP